jgi:NADH:ubiquinone oxidoreductase subunit E
MNIEICIGSSCYVKGSDKLVTIVREILADRHLESKIELKGSFCMSACTQGIGVRINHKMIRILDIDQAKKQINQAIDEELV